MMYLVISQQAERREEMKSLLRQLDRRALTQEAKDWREAEAVFSRALPDLAFADIAHADGSDALPTLLQHYPRLVIATISDDPDPQNAIALLRAGLRAVIPRTLNWRSMIRALELVLLGGHYVPAHALRLHVAPHGNEPWPSASERALPYRRRLINATTLSPRQQQIIRLVHMGSTNKAIARALGISEGTVKIHLATIFKVLGASNRAAAVAIYNGWLFNQAERLPDSPDTRPSSDPGGIGTPVISTTTPLPSPIGLAAESGNRAASIDWQLVSIDRPAAE